MTAVTVEHMTAADHPAASLAPGAIRRWLALGWRDLRGNPGISLGYATPFVILGMLIQWGLLASGYTLVHYLFAGGFLILLPPLLVVYYQIARDGGSTASIGPGSIVRALRNTPPAIWGLLLITAILYLIWITDALIIYTVYFTLDPIDYARLTGEAQLRLETREFLFHVSLLGALLALIAFFITAFAIPRAFNRRCGLVDAVVYSIRIVIRHFRTMAPWALLVGGSQYLALLVLPPLELFLLPLFAYANHHAYLETLGD